MPYDANGIYNLPGGYQAVTGQTIQASQHNPPLQDIAAALSQVLLRSGLAPMTGNLPMGGFRITGMANGIAPSDGATVAQAGVPIGTVLDFAGASAPTGFLLCYGQAVSRSTYAELFSAIGTAYGAGDGSTTFNVPDARGRVSAGKDNMGGTSADRLTNKPRGVNGDVLGAAGGFEENALTVDQIPPHAHSGTTSVSGDHFHDNITARVSSPGSGTGMVNSGGGNATVTMAARTNNAGAHAHTFGTNAVGGGMPFSIVQPTIIFNKIIKVART